MALRAATRTLTAQNVSVSREEERQHKTNSSIRPQTRFYTCEQATWTLRTRIETNEGMRLLPKRCFSLQSPGLARSPPPSGPPAHRSGCLAQGHTEKKGWRGKTIESKKGADTKNHDLEQRVDLPASPRARPIDGPLSHSDSPLQQCHRHC